MPPHRLVNLLDNITPIKVNDGLTRGEKLCASFERRWSSSVRSERSKREVYAVNMRIDTPKQSKVVTGAFLNMLQGLMQKIACSCRAQSCRAYRGMSERQTS